MEGGSNAVATTMSDITTAITTAASTVATNFNSMLGGLLPVILGVIGVGIVVALGVKWFNKMRKA